MFEFIENFLLFRPTRASQGWSPVPEEFAVEDVWILSTRGDKIHAWWLPPPAGKPHRALIYCHGNGGNLSYRFDGVKRWHQSLDLGVLIFDYPGYGKSSGKPSESGCHDSANASLNWLFLKGFKPRDLIYYGGSLGGAIACKLAQDTPPACLVLNSAFTSFKAMAQKLYPRLPGLAFLKTKLDTLSWIKFCYCPVFISHGTADRLVPYSQAEELFAAAAEPKFLHPMKNQDHHHSPNQAFYSNLKAFLNW